jgi:hypothetical protein
VRHVRDVEKKNEVEFEGKLFLEGASCRRSDDEVKGGFSEVTVPVQNVPSLHRQSPTRNRLHATHLVP